jgi:predicted nuclease of predicted toxin-antitoxin system
LKLLFDQNLSPRLVRLLADIYPESSHIHQLGMDRASDSDIWRFAAENGYTIVSKDADFHQRSLVLGGPPTVVWLRLGNCSVVQTASLLRKAFEAVAHFHDDGEAAFLALA